jgi:oligosaccharyltransferase complex subunit epsilon
MDWDDVLNNLIKTYQDTTPQRTKLIDVFLAFLVAVGVVQFLYCILAGNYVRSSARPLARFIA